MSDPGVLKQVATLLLGGYRSAPTIASQLPEPLTIITATHAQYLAVTDSQGHDFSGYVIGDWNAGYGYAVVPTALATGLSVSVQPKSNQIAQLNRYELQPDQFDQATTPILSWNQSNILTKNKQNTSINDVPSTTILNKSFERLNQLYFWLNFQDLALPEVANIDTNRRQQYDLRYHPKKHRPRSHQQPWGWLLIGLSVPVGLGWLAVRHGRIRGPT